MRSQEPPSRERPLTLIVTGLVFAGIGVVVLVTGDLDGASARGGYPLWVLPSLLVVSGGALTLGGIVAAVRR